MSSERIEYGYVYKCRLCGELRTNPRMTVTRMEANLRLLTIVHKGSCTNGFTVELTDLHSCSNGDIGIADLQGLAVINP